MRQQETVLSGRIFKSIIITKYCVTLHMQPSVLQCQLSKQKSFCGWFSMIKLVTYDLKQVGIKLTVILFGCVSDSSGKLRCKTIFT